MVKDALSDFIDSNPNAAARLAGLLGEDAALTQEVESSVATATGILSVDMTLGALPSGLIEFFGEESVGKTALLAHTTAYSQRSGMSTALLATERVDMDYWERCGVDLSSLALIPPGHLAFEMCVNFLRSNPRAFLAIDTLTSFWPHSMVPGERNQFLFDFLNALGESLTIGSCVVAVSEARARRSLSQSKMYAGGSESSMRRFTDLFSTRIELMREDIKETSYTMLVNVVSNLGSMPATWTRVPMIKGGGVDLNLDFLRAAVRSGSIEQRGPRFYFDGKHLGLGEVAAAKALTPELKEAIIDTAPPG